MKFSEGDLVTTPWISPLTVVVLHFQSRNGQPGWFVKYKDGFIDWAREEVLVFVKKAPRN